MIIERTKINFVPFALCAIGLAMLFTLGCSRDEKPQEPAAHESANYMNDPVFVERLAEARRSLAQLNAERKSVADKMQSLIDKHGEDKAKLEKIAEWNDLYRKITELNEKYETARRGMLKFVGERIKPTNDKK